MVKRRSKKNKSGTHGHGSSKKNRGAGSRGGRGKAGGGKKAGHHKVKGGEVNELGETGFNRHGSREQDGINLRDIDQRIEEFVETGFAEETDEGYVFHADKAGYSKILGTGKLTRDIEIRAEEFSGSAEDKIEEAGAEAVEIEE